MVVDDPVEEATRIMLGTILIILLVLALLGALPGNPWMAGRSYGYAPSGGLGVLLIIVVVLLFLHVI